MPPRFMASFRRCVGTDASWYHIGRTRRKILFKYTDLKIILYNVIPKQPSRRQIFPNTTYILPTSSSRSSPGHLQSQFSGSFGASDISLVCIVSTCMRVFMCFRLQVEKLRSTLHDDFRPENMDFGDRRDDGPRIVMFCNNKSEGLGSHFLQ